MLCGICMEKRDAHARFFVVLLAFSCTFCGTVVAGGSPYGPGQATYMEAMKAFISAGNPMGGGFGSAIAATIVQFFALVLSLIADCRTPAEGEKEHHHPHHAAAAV